MIIASGLLGSGITLLVIHFAVSNLTGVLRAWTSKYAIPMMSVGAVGLGDGLRLPLLWAPLTSCLLIAFAAGIVLLRTWQRRRSGRLS